MDKKTIALIIMGMIILAGASVYAYNYLSIKAYNEGVQDSTLLINQQILNSLQQDGYVPFMFVENNQTYNIKLIPSLS